MPVLQLGGYVFLVTPTCLDESNQCTAGCCLGSWALQPCWYTTGWVESTLEITSMSSMHFSYTHTLVFGCPPVVFLCGMRCISMRRPNSGLVLQLSPVLFWMLNWPLNCPLTSIIWLPGPKQPDSWRALWFMVEKLLLGIALSVSPSPWTQMSQWQSSISCTGSGTLTSLGFSAIEKHWNIRSSHRFDDVYATKMEKLCAWGTCNWFQVSWEDRQ